MINFENEIVNFTPSLEVSAGEDAIIKSDMMDANDLLMELIKKETRGQDE